MTPFASALHVYLQTERGAVSEAALVADFTLYRRTWEKRAAAEIPANVAGGVREALAELLAYGRVERVGSTEWRYLPEKAKAEAQGRMF